VGITWVTQKLGNLTEIGEVLGYGQKSSCDKYKSSGAGKGLQHFKTFGCGFTLKVGSPSKHNILFGRWVPCMRAVHYNKNHLGMPLFYILGFFSLFMHILGGWTSSQLSVKFWWASAKKAKNGF
jgi:hypothetical protein